MSVKGLVSNSPSVQEREFAGWKLPIRVETENLTIDTEARYKKVEVEPILDLEGEIMKVGRKGLPVKTKVEWKYYEGDEEISEKDIRFVQKMPDGSVVEVEPLSRIDSVEIRDMPMDNVVIDDNKSYGTFVPRHIIDNFAQESTYEVWGNLVKLAEYLEKHNLAIMFPFTFGRGFKITTALIYPVRIGNNLHLIMVLSSGVRKLSKPLIGVVEEVKKPAMSKPILKRKQVLNGEK